MRFIKEYLSTKIKNVSSFPTDGDNLDSLIYFLESYGFKGRKMRGDESTYAEFHNISKQSNGPFYLLGEYKKSNVWTHWIVFGNGGAISENNPLYLCRTTKEIDETQRYLKNTDDSNPIDHTQFDNYAKFRKDVINNLFT